jgi:hypothetical protein
MADAGVVRDANRLPWLEPYRAPPRKKSNRKTGVTAVIGATGLAAVVTLLTRDMVPAPASEPPREVSVTLPAPADMQPQIILPPLHVRETPAETAKPTPDFRRPAPLPRRKIKAIPTTAAYREVVKEQTGEVDGTEVVASEAALAIADLPLPPDPPRPAVDPTAQLVRGKTVQMGVYLTKAQAEAAWQSAVRDYTYLVTMPKNIEAISIRSKRFYRLQLGTPSKRHAKELCTNLKSIGRACKVA